MNIFHLLEKEVKCNLFKNLKAVATFVDSIFNSRECCDAWCHKTGKVLGLFWFLNELLVIKIHVLMNELQFFVSSKRSQVLWT